MTAPVKRHHKDTVRKIIKIGLTMSVSIVLVLWFFHKVNWQQVGEILHRGVDYQYIAAMMALTILSHVIRGIRWGIQLRAAGIPRIPAMAESVSIFGAYALNLVFPFCGEAWRCVYISHREQCPLSTVVGTDLGDRASDGIMIGLLIWLTLIVDRASIDKFLDKFSIGESIMRHATDGSMWIWVAICVAVVIAADYVFRRTSFVQGINRSAKRIWDGFKVLFHMKGTGMYLILTLGIWTCYFLETYVCFFAFPFTRHLIEDPGTCYGLLPGLLVFVFGSCSMIVPSNGGLGPWNIAVMFALTLCGVSQSDGAAYSLVVWSFQAMILIASGIYSAIYISISRRHLHITQKAGQQ